MTLDLRDQFLIATPGIGDPRFAQSVVYLCAHSDEGAMGLIVNKPSPGVRFVDLLAQLGLTAAEGLRDIRVHFGGPVEEQRGFVLHSTDYDGGLATMQVGDAIAMTATVDILEAIAKGRGPASTLMALGYAGWGPGQLEAEIAANGWITAAARPDLVFGRANEHKWSAALKSIGINPLTLSSQAGRA